MNITLIEKQKLKTEQMFEETAFAKFVLQSLKGIIADDTYDLFKIKSRADFDKKNSEISKLIDRLIDKQRQSKEQIETYQVELDKVQSDNLQFIENLREIL